MGEMQKISSLVTGGGASAGPPWARHSDRWVST